MNERSYDCDVLVVGAGPTGLTLATALGMRGVRVNIIDRLAVGANTSRAAVVHARTLEVLERIAVADRLTAKGLKCETFSVKDRDRNLMSIGFKHLPTRYPYTLMISQATTEAVLVERLNEVGVCVDRPRTLAALTQDGDGVEVLLDDGTRRRSRYVVGADGMHSKVRELAGIGFSGDRYEQSFVLADAYLSGMGREEVILYFSPAGMVVVAPLPGGAHRIVATVDEAPESPDSDFVQGLLDLRGPERNRVMVQSIVWGSRFRVHHRIADRYRQGRIVLAGDAAHVHSPAGGQGMNTGIQDAIALADSLEQAIQTRDAGALDRYEAERRPVAERVITLADRLTRMATVSRTFSPLRNVLIRTVARRSKFRERLAMQLAGLAGLESREQNPGRRSTVRTNDNNFGRRVY